MSVQEPPRGRRGPCSEVASPVRSSRLRPTRATRAAADRSGGPFHLRGSMRSVPTGSFDRISSLPSLWAAWRAYRSGKRRWPATARFELRAEEHLLRLARDLRQGSYAPGRQRCTLISRPKRRLIAAAPLRDRVAQRALYDELAPHYQRSYIDDSYAGLPGRGTHRAVLRLLARMRRWPWMLGLDLRRYFLSISHDRLFDLLRRRLRDPRTLALIRSFLSSSNGLYQQAWVVRALGLAPDPVSPGYGLPIGSLTSQWWGNLYLDGLDHFVKRELKVAGYQRYADDLTLFGDSRAELLERRDAIEQWLHSQRGLQLNQARTRLQQCHHGFDYLGYRVRREGIDPGPKLKRRIRTELPKLAQGPPQRLARALASWRAAYCFPTPPGAR